MGILRRLANRLLGGDSDVVRDLVAERDSLIHLEETTARTAADIVELRERIRESRRRVERWESNVRLARALGDEQLTELASERLDVATSTLWEYEDCLDEALSEQERIDAKYGHASEHRNKYLMRLTVLLNEGYPVHHLGLPDPPIATSVETFAEIHVDAVVSVPEEDEAEQYALRLFEGLPKTPRLPLH